MDWTYVENVAYAHVLAADKLVPGNDKVAGQAFFITNDEPAPFWDMAKYIWKNLDYPTPTVVVPYWLAYYLALLLDWIVWLLSPLVSIHLTFTFFRVVYAGAHR
jgi:sterol-4alpha-carboxylate 3-dehydrogenase (decarboxylating)